MSRLIRTVAAMSAALLLAAAAPPSGEGTPIVTGHGAWEVPDAIIGFQVTVHEMPDGSGDYLVGRLNEAEETREIPVIVLTAHTLDGRKDYALEREFVGRLGAVSYLAKPISLDALAAEVARFVSLPSHGSP